MSKCQIFTSVLVLLCASTAEARVVHEVFPGEDIQAAIGSAADGDVVWLSAGEHTGCLSIDSKVVHLMGEGSDITSLQCNEMNTISINAVAGRVEVSGLTLMGDPTGTVDIRGLYIQNTDMVLISDLTVQNMNLTNNGGIGDDGAGVYIHNSDLSVRDSLFETNIVSSKGGVFYAQEANLSISSTDFTENTADLGGVGYLLNSELSLTDSLLGGNDANSGGAFYSNGFAIEAIGNYFAENSAVDGGAIYVDTGAYRSTSNVYSQNTVRSASGVGGALYASSGASLDMVFDTFEGDGSSINAWSGGAVYSKGNVQSILSSYTDLVATNDGGAIVVTGDAFSGQFNTYDNCQAYEGGAIYLSDADGHSINGSTFSNNFAGLAAGALSLNNAKAAINKATFSNNSAFSGGGALNIYASEVTLSQVDAHNNSSDYGGSALYNYDSTVSILGGDFSGNTALNEKWGGYGGAIFNYSSTLSIEGSNMSGNEAYHYGGAIFDYLSGSLDITNVTFSDNQSQFGGGAVVSWANNDNITISRSAFTNNTSSQYGGAILIESEAIALVDGNLFCANTANNGGAIYSSNPTVYAEFYNNVFAENVAELDGGAIYEYSIGSGTSHWIANSVIGNSSTNASVGGIVNSNLHSQYISHSLFLSNDDIGLKAYDGSLSQSEFNLFWDHGTADFDGNVSEYSSAFTDPGITDWSRNGDCTDDNYVVSYGSYGAQAGSDMYPSGVLGDYDGDGYTIVQGDCVDSHASINPGATEIHDDMLERDEDCDGIIGQDGDGDGYIDELNGGIDCDDLDPLIYGGAPEIWYDSIDQNCANDDDFDQDKDGFTSDAYGGLDCNDEDASINPDTAEILYDGVDQNCDGVDDDADQDGHPLADDCNDFDGNIHTGAAEIYYDGIDQNCDGLSDFDADQDGYDSLDDAKGDDCNDNDSSVNPGASEVYYDGVDQDCDGLSDFDADQDGQNSSSYGGDDCDDTDPTVYLGAKELADGQDNDCDGIGDPDTDGDGIIDELESAWGTGVNETDSDGDGIADNKEWGDDLNGDPVDSDGDGTIDVLDEDSDNDGVLDQDEGTVDSDGDGIPNYLDTDDDGDGIDTSEETAEDTDGDGIPNYLDHDSDNDGSSDSAEGTGDYDNDGIPNYLDNGDGSGGEYTNPPGEPEATGFGCSSTPLSPVALWPVLLGLLAITNRRRLAS